MILKMHTSLLKGSCVSLISREIMYSESYELMGNLGVICLLQWLDHIKDETAGEIDWDAIDFKGILANFKSFLTAYSKHNFARDAIKYLQRSLDVYHQDSIVSLLCSILLAIDVADQVMPILELYRQKQPKNPHSQRLFIDYSLFYNNGTRDLEKETTRKYPEWLDAAQRLLKIDPTCDYALSLLVKFNECHEGVF
jgi:hypothetical protein